MITETTTRVWSDQQIAIFNWFETGSNHLVVRARAGTGKTTTITEGVNRAPEQNIVLCAFNKRIAEELTLKVTNPNATVKTLHSLGFACVRRFRPSVRILNGNERADWLAETVCGPHAPDAIKRLVSKLHSKGREIVPHARVIGDLTSTAEEFECEPDEQWSQCQQCGQPRDGREHAADNNFRHDYDGFDLEYVESKALAAMELAATDQSRGIDFADMIFLPVRNHWLSKTYDLVVVDEAQDMTTAQLEIAQGICNGRICVVGDDRQAIYKFRGADSESLDRLKAELNADELGLTITYRCGRRIVEEAQALVPDFEAGPNNPDGAITYLNDDPQVLLNTVALGDFVLSRVNAPLVSLAMMFLRNNKRARIAGRDIGAGLKALIRKLSKGRAAKSVPELLAKIAVWKEREVDRMLKAKKEDRADAIRDQAEVLISLTDGAKSVADVEARIDALFTDDGLGQAGVITLSSVHRAKGLEANRVFVLASTLRNNDQEELNIAYVAITRAKQELVYVRSRV